jgi:hypothetical protein
MQDRGGRIAAASERARREGGEWTGMSAALATYGTTRQDEKV